MTSLLWSQESQQEKLEERKAQIQKEIRENERLLQTVKKKEKSAVNVVVIQSTKIKLKEKLINTTEKQTKLLGNDMYINQVQINKLKKELAVLKEDYAEMIVKSYKSRSEESRAMFLLSSENFLQAYKRAQYMKQYTSFRKMQGEEIKSKSNQLTDYNEKLNVQKKAKQKLIAENEKERLSLEKEKKEQLKLVSVIKKDKNKISQEIRKRQQEYRAIDRQINKLIREAIAAANRKAALEKAKANPSAPVSKAAVSSSKIELTPESKIIADNFRANRGRLPYPVEKGFISLGYGNQTHPLFNTITVHNSGVEITTDRGANARAVFGGEVTSVIVLSPVNKAVMIQHGDYFTVYQNLSSVNVSKGDKVSIKQSLGKVRTNGETGKTVIKFLILQNTTYNNPEGWLSPR
ncbi:peptidoglycan DD-metalloendopeptidase family protein [Flavobacterium sp. LB2P84]|jgi:septal ring factor EnvC (AmiA/AmiB activator)|uniref:Peptidoglycan DD-metalloendopeptidase family protein n=1 Tax=Flavobacterium yafengii TaxID=3041253 RepID=A0AAW6TL03_9FLAO|nr:peptidoglycan DD-metalloendopeptidase family protein [Flavobacterium yafengii]MDI5898142.1 peptidoglycan DD-metalloendopeptidase family protein [Flavobacterium yafengii]MDI5948510.1 peptidoglycan DD-metalloendopeptidase family protein [Flavobacterium yafengii]MDI6032438.1 peptidoglycan DD-metalloendopeptidase family protein [Flavobacterium yafengii]MDI6045489.1 peptidoglycan DD-metalloendopeptidase family protein [Flavobacterium yafengii]